jgi:hypothetical protein
MASKPTDATSTSPEPLVAKVTDIKCTDPLSKLPGLEKEPYTWSPKFKIRVSILGVEIHPSSDSEICTSNCNELLELGHLGDAGPTAIKTPNGSLLEESS